MAERPSINSSVRRLHLARSQILVSQNKGNLITPWGTFEPKQNEMPKSPELEKIHPTIVYQAEAAD